MARYSEEIIEQVRQNNDVVDVISQYVHLTRKGRNYFGLCPFHNEKSPSFSVSPDRQIFHCFGCGVGGNVYSFLMKIEGIGFKEAVEQLAEKANIQLPTIENAEDTAREELKAKIYKINQFTAEYYHQNLYKPTAKMAQEYVKKRKLTQSTLETYKIGFSGRFDELYKQLKAQGFNEKEMLESGLVIRNDRGQYIDMYRNRLMIPICDIRGKVIAFGGRVLDDSKPKYINSPENVVYSKGRHLFGLNIAKTECSKRLLIVEGYMDVISLHQRGVKNVVAALGTALTEQQGWLLRKSTEQVILGFDADGAGQTAVARSMEILQKMGCDMRVLQIEGAKDPDEFIVKFGEGSLRAQGVALRERRRRARGEPAEETRSAGRNGRGRREGRGLRGDPRVPASLGRDRFRAHQAEGRHPEKVQGRRGRAVQHVARFGARPFDGPLPRESLVVQGVGRPTPALGTRTPLQQGASAGAGDRPPGEQHRLLRQIEERRGVGGRRACEDRARPRGDGLDDREGEADRQAGPGRK